MRGWIVVLIPLVILVGALVWLRVARYRAARPHRAPSGGAPVTDERGGMFLVTLAVIAVLALLVGAVIGAWLW